MNPERRRLLQGLGLALCLPALPAAAAPAPLRKPIPASGERLPAIGLGTWITFDVGGDMIARAERLKVLQGFFEGGGSLVDSSPMYASSEDVIGWCLKRLPQKPPLFAATKVWTWGRALGVRQMEASRRFWGLPRFDLMQIHNMLDWQTHLETLQAMKAEGRIRYIGITTSHGRRHEDLEAAMRAFRFDFVQFTYNLDDREAEARLLPLALERGSAVIANRPFQGGNLFGRVRGKPLPPWAREIDCDNWAQYFLKFIIAHPAVTCAIPATSKVTHLQENMGALYGRLPDAELRQRMARHFATL